MQLPERELKIRMKGEDVALMHKELTGLGFQIPYAEFTTSYFGPGTRRAVFEFQQLHGLKATGVAIL